MGSIERVGYRDKEISIEIDPRNLDKYYISLAQVIRTISNQHLNLPGGKLKSGSKEMVIRTVGELNSAEEFKEVIIRTNQDGKLLRKFTGALAGVAPLSSRGTMIFAADGELLRWNLMEPDAKPESWADTSWLGRPTTPMVLSGSNIYLGMAGWGLVRLGGGS